MTLLTGEREAAPWSLPSLGEGWRTLLLALGATTLTLLMSGFATSFVLRGGFGDPDDAMRLVEVRAWLGGQAWYDVSAHRLDPPLGASMHWSRLVDLPTAALIRLFSLAVNGVTAERWACVAVPSLWLLALYLGMARLATVLAGPASRGVAILGTLLSGAALVTFMPGRIGHHAPETVVLVLAVGTALASLEPGRARQGAVAGAFVALGLALILETMPFLVALCAAMVIVWVVRGEPVSRALAWFGLGLGVSLPALLAVGTPPDLWLAPVCDAMGMAHVGAGMIGAVGSVVLARAPRLRSRGARAAGAAVLGALVVAFVAIAYPGCLRSPFAGVDPLVRAIWLDHVVESKPLLAFANGRPMATLALVAPVVLGLFGALHAVARGTRAPQFATIAGLTALGLALAFWQVRVFASVMPLALCGGLHLVMVWRDRLAAAGLVRLAAFAPLFALPFTSTGWALALPDDPVVAAASKDPPKSACLAPDALAPLATLAPGRALAPIDLGSHLLVATPLDAFAAPYHRNDDGNRFMIDAFLAPPDAARALLAARQVTYVILCPGTADLRRLATRAPDGLAARLAAGDTPAFLAPAAPAGTPYKIYRVRAGS